MTNFEEADLYLPARGILPETAATYQVQKIHTPSHDQLEKWLGQNSQKLDAAIVFPNLVLDDDGSAYPSSYSVRCFPPSTDAYGKARKFLATRDVGGQPYVLPPVWGISTDSGAPIFIVEKQCAALLLRQSGLNAIALDGTFGVAAKRVEGEKVTLHGILTQFSWIGRPVFLCFDIDFRNRESVLQGMIRSYVLFSIAGAVVRVVQWDQSFKGLDDFIAARAGLDVVKQRQELDALTTSVSALPPREAAEKWIIPQYRTLFEREIAAIQPGMAERSQLAEQIFEALGTTKSDLKKTWGISTKEDAPPSIGLVEDTEAWSEPVNGLAVIEEVMADFKRHVVMTEVNYHANSLWTFLCHMKEHVSLLPILGISSPTKRCGKTNLLLVLERLCWKPLLAAGVSPAATFRTISKYEPCFLIDEFDAFMAQNEEFRGILNCCHTKGLKIIRCAPETHEPEAFYVFCPVAIATIGTLPDTVADRTIAIRLGRKQSARKTVPVRKAPIEPFIVLRRKIRRWVLDNAAVINSAEFLLPELSNDRALENWETMAQIATVLGGPWPLRAFTAAKTLTPSDNDEQSFTIQLLVSLRRLFQGVGLDHPPHEMMILATDKIVAALNLEKQAPWADKKEFFNGLTAKKLGSELRKFKVRSHRDWKVSGGPSGYCWKDLASTFKRYLDDKDNGGGDDEPPPPSNTPPTPSTEPETNKSAETQHQSCDPVVNGISTSVSGIYEPRDCIETTPTLDQSGGGLSASTTDTYSDLPQDHRIDPEKSENLFNLLPPSTPAAGFCKATHPDRIVGVDTETFYPWPPESEITAPERRRRKDGKAHPLATDSRRNGIRLLTVNTGLEIRVFDLLTETVPEDIRELLRTSTLVLHNADFDVTVLRRHGFELSSSIFDTMLASQLLSLGKSNPKRGSRSEPYPDDPDNDDHNDDDDEDLDLEEGFDALGDLRPADNDLVAIVQRYLGFTMKKAQVNLGASDWGTGSIGSEQLVYAAADVAHFPDLVVALTKELKAAKLWDCFRERSEFFVHLNNIKFAGVPVNRDLLVHDQQICEGLKLEKRVELKELFKDYRPPIPKSRRKKSTLVATDDLFQGAVLNAEMETEEFNPNAPAQVVAALALHGIEVSDTTKETLAGIDSPETRTLLAYKEQMALFTMIKGIARSVFPDARVRPAGWNQLAAKTGRIMSSRPNLQNLPRNWRAAFEAPDPFQWLRIDLAQIEMYIIAIHCQDEKLISFLASGRDVYVEVASEIFGKQPVRGTGPEEVTDLLRSAAKTLTLGISYGMGPGTFIRRVEVATRPKGSVGVPGLLFEMEEAKDFFTKFFDMFPGIGAYHAEAKGKAATEECTYTVTGQRRFLPPLLNDQDKYTGYWPSLEFRKRCIINSPIQGSAADMFVRAVNKFAPDLRPPAQIVNLVHDEIDLLVTEETADTTIALVTKAFEESFTELFGSRLKAKLEHSIGKSWAK